MLLCQRAAPWWRQLEAESPLATDGVRIVAARLDLEPAEVSALAAWLSIAETERVARYRFEPDRRRFIVARVRLRQLLAEVLDIDPLSVRFGWGSRGKPVLDGELAATGWQFNMARSGELAVYALSQCVRVGIDVEEVREIRGAEDIAAQFFSPREHAEYQSLAADDRRIAFFNCWTRKEAFVKALGEGLAYPGECFDVSLAPGEPACLRRVERISGEAAGWRLDALAPLPGFIGALASETPPVLLS